MASLNFQLPDSIADKSLRCECLELAAKLAEACIDDLGTATREIVEMATAFEAFIKGTLGVIDEQPPEPNKADAPKSIRAWVSRDKRAGEVFDIFTIRPPVKEVYDDGTDEMFVSDEGGDMIASSVDMTMLSFDIAPGQIVEVEITIRKV